jgi:serine protease Do
VEKLENHWHGMTALALDGPQGPVTVARLDRKSPAERCGLRRGDQLERIGDLAIRRPLDVERALLGQPSGARIPLVVRRGDETVDLDLRLTSRSENRSASRNAAAAEAAQQAIWETLGLKLRPEPAATFRALNIPYRGGMRVVAVRPDSSAALQGVQAGDVLVKMHRWTTASEKDMRFIVDHADALARVGKVKFYVVRGEETFFGHLSVASRAERVVR